MKKAADAPPPWKPSPRLVLAVFAAVAIFASLWVPLKDLPFWHKYREIFYLNDEPIMTTMDAYFYLRLTSDHLEGRYDRVDEKRPGAERPQPVPLICTMTGLVHSVTGISLANIAFFTPPLLALFMVLAYFLVGSLLGGPSIALIASLAGATSYYWFSRICLGRFDTDALNPFFIFFMSYSLYRFAVTPSSKRFLHLGAVLVSILLFCLWWPQAGYFSIVLLALAYGLSLFVIPSPSIERYVKSSILLCGAFSVLVVIFGFYNHFPPSLARPFEMAAGHLALVTKEANSAFPEIGQSITELEAPSLERIAMETSGHIIPLLTGLAGLILLAWRRRDVAIFLLPAAILSLMMVFSNRFLIFFVPLYAIGLGYLLGEVLPRASFMQSIRKPSMRYALIASLTAALVAPSAVRSLSTKLGPPNTSNNVLMAETIKNESAPEATVWAWWDDGYFVQHFADRKTFIDGGSQSPDRTFIAAFPLSCPNPVLAANWIRFFATHDLGGLYQVADATGGPEHAIALLKEVFAAPGDADAILERYGIPDTGTWRNYLFPRHEAYVFIPNDFADKSYWWYYFGTWDVSTRGGVHPQMMLLNSADVSIDKDGVLTAGDIAVDLNTVVNLSTTQVTIRNHNRTNYPAAVLIQGGPQVYVMDAELLDSLAMRLLFRDPTTTRGFTPIFYHPEVGGVWRVE
jgi:dolichyl-diphosphooligosaccharide--protein glycosyltransferase